MIEGSRQWYILDGAEVTRIPLGGQSRTTWRRGYYAEYADLDGAGIRVPVAEYEDGAPLTAEKVALLNTVPFVIKHSSPPLEWLIEGYDGPPANVPPPFGYLIETLEEPRGLYWVNMRAVPEHLRHTWPDQGPTR